MSSQHGQNLETLVATFKKGATVDNAKELINFITTYKNGQHPEIILEVGITIAASSPGSLSTYDFLPFVEEFFYASIELKQLDWSQVFLTPLAQSYPKSIKTMRQMAMMFEASNNTFKAQELYLEILQGTPEDANTMKRLISLYKNNDMVNDAISMLNKYLEINQCDEEAWSELCDIYLNRQNFAKAAYCMEEVLASNPLNYMNNIRYAEIIFSVAMANSNNLSQLETCRKYFSHGLVMIDQLDQKKVNINVTRALWGLIKVCRTIQSVQSQKDKADPKNGQVLELALRRINQLYSQNTDIDISKMSVIKN